MSEDGEIAEVDSEGKVLAVSVGETHVVVTSLDGGFSKRCHVRVNPLVVPITVLTLAPSVAVIEVGQSLQLEAGVQPSTATSVDLVWSSSNESVAGVDQQGKVEGIKPGEAIITVKTAEGSRETFCELSVLDASVTSISVIPLEEVSVNPNPFTTALRVLHASHVQRYEVLNAMGCSAWRGSCGRSRAIAAGRRSCAGCVYAPFAWGRRGAGILYGEAVAFCLFFGLVLLLPWGIVSLYFGILSVSQEFFIW